MDFLNILIIGCVSIKNTIKHTNLRKNWMHNQKKICIYQK